MRSSDITKRVLDVALSAVLIVVTLPLLLVITIGTVISLRTNPFFTQTRVGKDGRAFRLAKVRTLPVHAPKYASKYDLKDLEVPWFSLLLRRTHVDELPQLFLVLTGKMSLVGPRPEMPFLHNTMNQADAEIRTAVQPGCTGLWQISEHCTSMIYEHPDMDRYYVANRNTRMDLWILFRTVLQVLRPASGLVTLETLPRWVMSDAAPRQTSLAAVDIRPETTGHIRPLSALPEAVEA
jgi:lipopolysaccharide/colanic/teichoic acid biosynthesis glycosyltransferase